MGAPPPEAEAVGQSLKSFSNFYSVVEQNFADPAKVMRCGSGSGGCGR